MGIPDHLTCLLRSLYADQDATVRTRNGTTDWFKLVKESIKAVRCSPVCLTYMQSTSWGMLGWTEAQVGITINWKITFPKDTSEKEILVLTENSKIL